MENNHVLQVIAQNTPPWVGVVVGHLSSDASLQKMALISSIAYSLVNIWAHFRKKK